MGAKGWISAMTGLALGGCASTGPAVDDIVAKRVGTDITPAGFSVCYAHGCKARAHAALGDAPWGDVSQLFAVPPASPAEERARIARAIQIIEIAVGDQTGLSQDLAGSFPGAFRKQQMDCVDEMVNTGTYLTLLNDAGLLKYYKPGRQAITAFQPTRNIWSHMVATIVERETGAEYIIDMWYGPHGELPYIMPLKDWMRGRALVRDF